MAADKNIRWGWLKAVYILTIIVAGGLGLGVILVPGIIIPAMNIPCSPVTYGIIGSVWLAFGLLSILGLRSPLRFVPVLLFQLVYKAAWLIGVALPAIITGKFPAEEVLTVVVFATIVILDLIAIPFRYVFAKEK